VKSADQKFSVANVAFLAKIGAAVITGMKGSSAKPYLDDASRD
jgi:hypothetical protein